MKNTNNSSSISAGFCGAIAYLFVTAAIQAQYKNKNPLEEFLNPTPPWVDGFALGTPNWFLFGGLVVWGCIKLFGANSPFRMEERPLVKENEPAEQQANKE